MIIREFNSFLVKACRGIPIKKLKSRIYHEMHEHMEDMLDVYLEAGEERETAIKKVVKDMGNPAIINKQLRREHRLEIISIYAVQIIVWFLIINLSGILTDITEYFFISDTKEEIEADFAEGEFAYKYCGEVEQNGRVYMLYARETPDENSVKYYESVRLFGFDIHDKFLENGEGYGDGNIIMTLGYANKKSEKESKVYFGFKPTKAKYFKIGFIKRDDCRNFDKPDNIISDFFTVPSPGEFTVIEAPEGYRFSGFYYAYDENKQIIETTDTDNFSIGQER